MFGSASIGELAIAESINVATLKQGAIVATLATTARYQATVETLPKVQVTLNTAPGR